MVWKVLGVKGAESRSSSSGGYEKPECCENGNELALFHLCPGYGVIGHCVSMNYVVHGVLCSRAMPIDFPQNRYVS